MTFHTIRQFGSVARKRVSGGDVGTAPSSGDVFFYYKCEDNAASATVTDAAGNNNGSSSPNTADITATGKISNGFDLDGTNDYIDIGAVFGTKLDADFSVSGWFYLDALPSATEEFVSFRGERNIEIRLESNNTLNFKIFTNPIEYKVTTATLSATTWYHFVVTRSTTNGMKIYLQGAEEDTDAHTGNGTASALTRNAIGQLGNDTNFFFDGIVDEICFFETELTADNVTYLYQGGTPGSTQQYPFT